MTNKEIILDSLIQDDEAFTQILEYFDLESNNGITRTELERLLAEMLEEGYIVINYNWKTEKDEHPYSLTEKGRKEWKNLQTREEMDKIVVYGELIYLISNYEKDTVSAKKIWTKKFKKSILESLELLKSISERIKEIGFTLEDEKCLNKCFLHPYINQIVIPELRDVDLISFNVSARAYNVDKISMAIGRIVDFMIFAIVNKEKKYKSKIKRLLSSVFCLSRVYLDSSHVALFQLTDELEYEKAVEYSMGFLEENEKKIIFDLLV